MRDIGGVWPWLVTRLRQVSFRRDILRLAPCIPDYFFELDFATAGKKKGNFRRHETVMAVDGSRGLAEMVMEVLVVGEDEEGGKIMRWCTWWWWWCGG